MATLEILHSFTTAHSITLRVTGASTDDIPIIHYRHSGTSISEREYYTEGKSSFTFTIENLAPSTTYVINVDADGAGNFTGAQSATTKPVYLELGQASSTSIEFTVYPCVIGNTIRVFYRPSEDEHSSTLSKEYYCDSEIYTDVLDGLDIDTNYIINVDTDAYGECYGSGDGDVTGAQYFTTVSLYKLSIIGRTATSVTILVTPCVQYNTATIFWTNQDTSERLSQDYYCNSSSFTYTITGLEPETIYAIRVDTNADGGGMEDWTNTVYTLPRPLDWEWWSVVARKAEIKLSAAEWNAFTSRINEFRTYKSLSNYNFSRAISGETEISAFIVNQAITAIAAMDTHGILPSEAISGKTKVSAAFFNGLKDALNAVV